MELNEIIKFDIKKTILPHCLQCESIKRNYADSLSESVNILNRYGTVFNTDNFIFSISEINYHKGYHVLLKACGALLNEGYNFDIVIAGKKNDDYIFTLNDLIREYGMERNVHFIGQIDDVEKFVLLMKSKVYVIPSLNEGYGLGAQEASLLGVKTIATDTGAHRELLGNKDYNIIIEPGDITGMKHAIIASLMSERQTPNLDSKKLCDLSCDVISKKMLSFFNS